MPLSKCQVLLPCSDRSIGSFEREKQARRRTDGDGPGHRHMRVVTLTLPDRGSFDPRPGVPAGRRTGARLAG